MLIPSLASRAPRQALAVALIGVMTAGCYTTTMIAPTEVPRLAIAAAPPDEPRTVHDLAGNVVTIGDRFTLRIQPRPDLPPAWAQWGELSSPIKSPFAAELRGPMLMLQSQDDPAVVQVPLAYVQHVRVREYSSGKTAGLAIGATVAGIALFVGIGFAIASSRTFQVIE